MPVLVAGTRSARTRVSKSRRASYGSALGLWCPLEMAAGYGSTGASFVVDLVPLHTCFMLTRNRTQGLRFWGSDVECAG
jgi:hypothetical protein